MKLRKKYKAGSRSSTSGPFFALGRLNIRMLNLQTPYVQVVTNCNNHIKDEAAVYSDAKSKTHENKRDLVCRTQSAWPSIAEFVLQPGANAVDNAKEEGREQYVLIREPAFREMSGDDLADRIGVDEADKERERHEVIDEDLRAKREVRRNEDPRVEEWEESKKRAQRVLFALTASLHDVDSA